MSITPDTIGPDFPAPSADQWHPHAGLQSRDEMAATILQLRKDLATVGCQRDDARREVDRLRGWADSRQRIIEAQDLLIENLRTERDEANERAALNEQACLDLLGQIEDRNTQTAAQLRIAATALGHLEEMHR